MMPMDSFVRLIEEYIKVRVYRLGLNFAGEPTLNPEFPEMVRYVGRKKIRRVGFSTNAMKIPDELIDALKSAPGITVKVSVHTNPNLVLENVKRLRKNTRNRIVSAVNLGDFERNECFSLAKRFKPFSTLSIVAPLIKEMKWVDTPAGFRGPKKERCGSPLGYLAVLWDGRAVLCCRDIAGETAFGNVLEDGIKKTYEGSEYRSVLKELEEHPVPQKPLCKKCTLWKRVPKRLEV
jgi:MoaA/NifB/PqqE/SkfB family radical SAM enzyme